jgi:hypothetical protein
MQFLFHIVDEICSPDTIFLFPGYTRFVLKHNFFVPCVDEIFILVPYVDKICSSHAILVPYRRRDLFLRHNILVPRVDEICSLNTIFLFLVSMRYLFLFPMLTRFVL